MTRFRTKMENSWSIGYAFLIIYTLIKKLCFLEKNTKLEYKERLLLANEKYLEEIKFIQEFSLQKHLKKLPVTDIKNYINQFPSTIEYIKFQRLQRTLLEEHEFH